MNKDDDLNQKCGRSPKPGNQYTVLGLAGISSNHVFAALNSKLVKISTFTVVYGLLLPCKGITIGVLTAGLIPFLSPAWRRGSPPYIPTTSFHVSSISNACNQFRRTRLVDLGSGDGRIVNQVAHTVQIPCVGVELNPWLIIISRMNAFRMGVWKHTSFKCGDLWKQNYSRFDSVVVFGVEEIMPALEKKLGRELAHDSVVFSCHFPFPGKIGVMASAEMESFLKTLRNPSTILSTSTAFVFSRLATSTDSVLWQSASLYL
eukprot:gene1857-4954_t